MVDDKEMFDFSDYKSNILKDAEGNETVEIIDKIYQSAAKHGA